MATTRPRTLEDEYLQIVHDLEGDLAGREAGEEYLRATGAHALLGVSGWALTPYVLSAAQAGLLADAARTLSSIMEKVMAKYHRDRSFRAHFGLSPEIEAMTLVPTGRRAAVPLARVDVLFDQRTNDYKISGIVTGGIDGMAGSVEVVRAVRQSASFHEFASRHGSVESFDAVSECILTLLHTYGNWANAKEGRNHPTNPALAVVDYDDSARRAETDYVIERMHEMGCYAHATDPSRLRIERVAGVDQVVDDRGPITCAWLRATADEAVAHGCQGIDALLRATRRGLVCTIGGYRSWPCCTQGFLEVLRDKECRALFSSEEEAFVDEHVIETCVITTATDVSRFYDQENWVLKVSDAHTGVTTHAGRDMGKAAWRALLTKAIRRNDAVQAYVPQHVMRVLPGSADGGDARSAREVNVVLGMYLFSGELRGLRALCGTGGTTVEWEDPRPLACLVARD